MRAAGGSLGTSSDRRSSQATSGAKRSYRIEATASDTCSTGRPQYTPYRSADLPVRWPPPRLQAGSQAGQWDRARTQVLPLT